MEHNESNEVISCLFNQINKDIISDVEVELFNEGKRKRTFFVSSFLLASRSELFLKMFFTSSMKEQQTKKWEIKDNINSEIFLDFLHPQKYLPLIEKMQEPKGENQGHAGDNKITQPVPLAVEIILDVSAHQS